MCGVWCLESPEMSIPYMSHSSPHSTCWHHADGQIFKSVGKLESLRRPTEWAVLGRTNAINSVEVVSVIHTCYRNAHPEAMTTARRT